MLNLILAELSAFELFWYDAQIWIIQKFGFWICILFFLFCIIFVPIIFKGNPKYWMDDDSYKAYCEKKAKEESRDYD